jgi:hypothetical protein
MPPTVDATSPHEVTESSRSLDHVGAVAVLGAMVEQRRRCSSIPPPNDPSDDSDAIATQRRERIAPHDDVFQKIR